MPDRILYLVKPAAGAGRGLARWTAMQARLAEQGRAGTVFLSRAPGDLQRAAREGAAHHDLLVAVGGDGAVLEVATGLTRVPNPRAALAILPSGTGNDAARMVGVADPGTALRTLGSGAVRDFDAIHVRCHRGPEVVERTALVFGGAGLAADILTCTPAHLKRWLGGPLGYAAGFFLALCRYRPYPVVVGDPAGTRRPEPLAAVVAANHTHAGGHSLHIGPGARPDDGLMEVSVIQGLGRLAVARQFLQLRKGAHIHHPAVRYRRQTSVHLDAPGPVPVQADGEVLGHTPASFELVPAGLRILAPPRT